MRTRFRVSLANKVRYATGCVAWCVTILLTFILLKMFVVEIFDVKGWSMHPALSDGETVVVTKWQYGPRMPRNVYEVPWVGMLVASVTPDESIDRTIGRSGMFNRISPRLPQRGDIVAFNIPGNLHYCAVKRVTAIPGDAMPPDTVAGGLSPLSRLPAVPAAGDRIGLGTLDSLQRKAMEKSPYFAFDPGDSSFVALDDFIYLTGDNLPASMDSRRWGPVPLNLIIGKCHKLF